MPGNHQLFIRRNYPHGRLAARRGNLCERLSVSRVVELDAEPCGRLTDSPADLRRVLTDSGSENKSIDTAEYRRQSADLFGDAVDEVIDGESGRGLTSSEQVAHVVADARDAEQTG